MRVDFIELKVDNTRYCASSDFVCRSLVIPFAWACSLKIGPLATDSDIVADRSWDYSPIGCRLETGSLFVDFLGCVYVGGCKGMSHIPLSFLLPLVITASFLQILKYIGKTCNKIVVL